MQTKAILGVIVAIVGILGTTFAIAAKFVSQTEFTGSMVAIEKRLDRIENKVDRLIEAQNK